MKGKLFIIFIMVGIPALSFPESFLAALMLFGIIVFGVSMATDNTTPARRHDGR